MSGGRSVAVLGGSFDPPHAAHVLLAAYVMSTGDVDEVLVVPAWDHPLGKETRTDYEDRVHMCELAMGDLRRARVSRVEKELGGPSRTLNTIAELARRMPGTRFRLVIGADILEQTDRWYRWDDVARLAPPLVVGRGGYAAPDAPTVILPEISSTDIRSRLSRGQRTAGLLPVAVERYIREHGLYADDR